MNLLDLLLDSNRQLVEEVKALNYEQLNAKPSQDKWSISQICYHLYLSEKLFAKAIEKGLKDKDYESIAHKPINIVTDRTKKFESPEIAKPTEEPFDVVNMLNLLMESRGKLLKVLHAIDDKSILSKKAAKHLAFGELSLDQWIELLYLHEQRHIEQIKDIKLAISYDLYYTPKR